MAMWAEDPGGYVPPLSLWQLVEQHVSPEEHDEIKSMLGTSLVETTLDLHREVKMLLEIWQDYQEEALADKQKRNACLLLAEPPHLRERLVQEICFLADNIREKSASKGMNPSVILLRHNSQVLEYAEESKRCGSSLGSSSPQSTRSSDGRQTPLVTSDHAKSRCSLDSAITEQVFSANDKLNYLQFDEVCNRLRETLTKELEQLETDVAFLQACLTDACDNPEPTLTVLKEERSLLEKALLSTESLPNTPAVHKPPFLPAASASASVISTKPVMGPVTNTKLRPVHPLTSTASSSRTGPLKASHHTAHTLPTHCNTSTAAAGTATEKISSKTTAAPKAAESASKQGVDKPPRLFSEQSFGKPGGKGYPETRGRDEKREGSHHYSRLLSATTRVKVVPLGSVHEPRVDSASSRSLITPTPPPSPMEVGLHMPRPGSAQRFRQMVMSFREPT